MGLPLLCGSAVAYDSYYNSDGSYGNRHGNTIYNSDGIFSRKSGNTMLS
ncbi:hypothetical protein [Helicobacter cetorum]|nr:hypothetical protein [Helicobacter cetorum]